MRNTHRSAYALCFTLVWLMSLAALARPVPQGLWKFDDPSDLLEATVGSALLLEGTHAAAVGQTGTDGAVTIGPGSFYRCPHGVIANNDGTRVNAYTIVMDLQLDSLSSLHALIQPDTTNADDAAFFVDPGGNVGGPGTGYSANSVSQSQWFRVAIVVDLQGPGGAVDIYVNGVSWLHAEPGFWDAVRGADDIHQDGPFSLDPSDSASPWVLLFADNDGGDGEVVVSSVAMYDHALLSQEVSDLGGPERKYLLPTVSGATSVTFEELLALPAGEYETVFVTDLANVTGSVRLEKVVIDTPGTPTSIGEGYLNYFGQMIEVTNIARSGDGYTATCLFQMPGFLGGMKESVTFTIASGTCTMDGVHFELPNIEEDGVEVQNVHLDLDTVAGVYGAGGVVKLPTWGNGIGGDIELKAGLGPEIAGVRLPDVTKIDLQATGLDIPVGEVFALDTIGAGIANEFGLSNPVNWANSSLRGTMKIVVEPKFTIGGRSYFLFAVNANGSFSLHDGSLNVDGTGLLMNTINVASVHAHYDPPYYFDVGAGFNALDIFTGSIDAGISASGFHGDLRGTLGIPHSVPIVGGWTFADASAHLDNTEFEGALDVILVPAIPSVCTPQICFPPLCIGWWSCDSVCWAWIFPYPCNCHWHTACWTPPCIPQICTPAIPALKIHFGFKYVATTGAFSWDKYGPYNPWEIPIEAPIKTGDTNGAFYVLTNWWTADSASTRPIRSTQKALGFTKDGAAKADFFIDHDAPAALFRLNYENTDVTEVDMTVVTPGGESLHSADGALPVGFGNHLGYSRFNGEAREQVIVLLSPAQGSYSVTIGNEEALGNYTVDLLMQDHLPWGEITSIVPGEDAGEYEISWNDHDPEGTPLVRLFLDHDRDGSDGFLVATLHESGNTGTYTLDTSALNVHAGDYFVRLEVDDGVNAPYSFHSHDTIQVVPTGAPEPVTGIQFLPDDGQFHISWDPSPTPNLRGYLVLWKYAGEDLGHFDRRRFVPIDAAHLGVTVDGLANDEALLATVVAVDQEHRRSYPADIVRIIPHAAGTGSVPHIVSTPNPTATATYAYTYLPTMSDVDFGTYVWSLDVAPAGMTIDASCGLVTWTPTEEEEGVHDVGVRLTKNGDDTLADAQSFTIHVYPPHQVNGLEEHAYQVASAPATNTTDSGSSAGEKCSDGDDDENEPYEYQVLVHGPTDDLHFELAAGPDGMTIDPTTGLITWDVPKGAKGAWVRVLITAEGQHQLEQDFYLHVHRRDHFPSDTEDDEDENELDDWAFMWRTLFGCRAADAGVDAGRGTDGLGEFVLLAAVIALVWLAGRRRARAKRLGRAE